MNMEAACSSETPVTSHQIKRLEVQEDSNRENLTLAFQRLHPIMTSFYKRPSSA
jgi:hypothetical protein